MSLFHISVEIRSLFTRQHVCRLECVADWAWWYTSGWLTTGRVRQSGLSAESHGDRGAVWHATRCCFHKTCQRDNAIALVEQKPTTYSCRYLAVPQTIQELMNSSPIFVAIQRPLGFCDKSKVLNDVSSNKLWEANHWGLVSGFMWFHFF